MYNDIIELGQISFSRNSIGQETENTEWRRVYADVRSVHRTEFYSAAMANIRPNVVFAMADNYEYNDERVIRWNGKTYDVIRTYAGRSGTEIEIVAEMREKDGNRRNGA